MQVQFDSDVRIVDMRSAEGERVCFQSFTTRKLFFFSYVLCQVPLSSPVDPNSGAQGSIFPPKIPNRKTLIFVAAGLVELWLLKLESVMRESLKSVLLSASADFAVSPRVNFVLSWQSQIVRDVFLPPMKKCNIMKSGTRHRWRRIHKSSRISS